MRRLILSTFIIFSSLAQAKSSDSIQAYLSTESNSTDTISSFGIKALLLNNQSNFGGEIFTGISSASVLDTRQHEQEYVAWDLGVRAGYYSDVYAYVEAGLDLGELIIQSDRDDDYCCSSVSDSSNSLDGYVGVGIGLDLDGIRIEAFAKARQIDGSHWESDKQGFYGVRISIPLFNSKRR